MQKLESGINRRKKIYIRSENQEKHLPHLKSVIAMMPSQLYLNSTGATNLQNHMKRLINEPGRHEAEMKKNWRFTICMKNIKSKYRNGIWIRKMCLAHSEKWKKIDIQNRSVKPRKYQNAGRKGKISVFKNTGSVNIQQTEMKETYEKCTLEEQDNFRNQALQQKFHQKNRHLDSLPSKIPVTILKWTRE